MSTSIDKQVRDRREELDAFETNAAQAQRNIDAAAHHREQITDLERRRDRWATYADNHPSVPNPLGEHLQGFNYKKTGAELAAELDIKIAHLKSEITKLDRANAKLLT